MRREYDPYGEEGRDIKLQRIWEALKLKATYHSGETLFVPSPSDLAEAIGRTTGYLYGIDASRTHRSPKDRYRTALEEATGLTVIHRGGLVLGGEVDEEFKNLA